MSQQHPKIPSFSAAHDTPDEVIPPVIYLDDLIQSLDEVPIENLQAVTLSYSRLITKYCQADSDLKITYLYALQQKAIERLNSVKMGYNIQNVNTINNHNH